jgi:hypothetical protein
MYNVTSGEYCDNTPTEYSLSEYYGYTGTEEASDPSVTLLDWWLAIGGTGSLSPALAEEANIDYMFGHEGETLTNIPYTRFSFTRSTNIGTWFEYYAKKYFDENSAWPVLRLLTSNATDSYYLEWDHSAPNGFNIKSQLNTSRWDSVFQWTDSFNSQYSDDRKYNLYFSTVFIKSGTIPDLIDPGTIKYAGAFRYNDSRGGLDVLVCGNYGMSLTVSDQKYYCYDAGTYFGSAGNRNYYKRTKGYYNRNKGYDNKFKKEVESSNDSA